MNIASFIHTAPFYEITALLVLAAVMGGIGLMLRQPMVVSFIAAGVLAGSSAFGVVQAHNQIDLLAELGVAVLLFLVGLKLDLKLIRTLGVVSLATGLGQIVFTASIGFAIGLALGMTMLNALYVAVALTFSSTIIVVKLLSDKKEVDALHGRIAIGFLIVQDIFVVLAMMVLSAYGLGTQTHTDDSVIQQISIVIAYGLGMLAVVGLFIRYIANPLTSRIAHSPELLITFAIAWAALLAAAGDYMGFGKELGGLLAGISLASTAFREAIVARLSALRDFLLLFFFIALGIQLDLDLLGEQLLPAAVFSMFVLIGNPLIVLIIMGSMGYRKRTAFLAGLTVAQISEFSLIFMAMGVTLGHVNAESLGLVTLVGLITIALSVYMITYSHILYRWLEPLLGVFERRIPHRETALETSHVANTTYDAVLFGLGRYGGAIAHALQQAGFKLLAIDFNPDDVRRWRSYGYDTLYGDACDMEFIAALPLDNVRWVIATTPEHTRGLTHQDPRITLIDGLKARHYPGKIAVSTQNAADVATLKSKGADLVLFPFLDAAERAVERIINAASLKIPVA